jgi:hypothetical protein
MLLSQLDQGQYSAKSGQPSFQFRRRSMSAAVARAAMANPARLLPGQHLEAHGRPNVLGDQGFG